MFITRLDVVDVRFPTGGVNENLAMFDYVAVTGTEWASLRP